MSPSQPSPNNMNPNQDLDSILGLNEPPDWAGLSPAQLWKKFMDVYLFQGHWDEIFNKCWEDSKNFDDKGNPIAPAASAEASEESIPPPVSEEPPTDATPQEQEKLEPQPPKIPPSPFGAWHK